MRLWHQDLITRLPSAQLNGQHRECCALRGNGWGRPHATVNYVFAYNPARLYHYHQLIMAEKARRGHAGTDQTWAEPLYRGKKCPPWDPQDFDASLPAPGEGEMIYPEHNAAYLEECLLNLEEKGSRLLPAPSADHDLAAR